MMAMRSLALFLLALALAPAVLSDFHVLLLCYIGLYALVALGLVLLTGIGGLTSFGQAAFVGVGAYATAVITSVYGLSPWIGLAAGIAIAVAVALLLGALTLRLSGHFLPLGTIAWGISLYYLFGNVDFLGGHTGISGIPAISLIGVELQSQRALYGLIWVFVLLALWGVHNLLDSREGRAIRALHADPLMAEAMGVDTGRSKVRIFLIAAVFAAVSGWLYAHLQRFVNPTPFGLHIGIEYLFMAVIGGVASIWGALVGAAAITLLREWLQTLFSIVFGISGNVELIVFGIMMVLVLQLMPNGIWPAVVARLPKRSRPGRVVQAEPLPVRVMPERGRPLLEVRNATKRFGGLVANDAVSFSVAAGDILAVIGPNGAGKSTMFNCLTGVLAPSGGELRLLGRSIAGLGARRIAQMGVARTFQHVRLMPDRSVLDNAALGLHGRGGKGVVSNILRLDREEEARLLSEAARQLQRVGLGECLDEPAGQLALGQQRILEIARALCADPQLLLLDEPAAGLRYQEKQALAALLRKLKDEGMTILLVEHDMDFVMGLADRIVVMDFGRKIAEGLPGEIRRDPAVREAYLGADA